jgi:hypothetical protein
MTKFIGEATEVIQRDKWHQHLVLTLAQEEGAEKWTEKRHLLNSLSLFSGIVCTILKGHGLQSPYLSHFFTFVLFPFFS